MISMPRMRIFLDRRRNAFRCDAAARVLDETNPDPRHHVQRIERGELHAIVGRKTADVEFCYALGLEEIGKAGRVSLVVVPEGGVAVRPRILALPLDEIDLFGVQRRMEFRVPGILYTMIGPQHLRLAGKLAHFERLPAAMGGAKLPWPGGCQSCVATIRSYLPLPIRVFATATT